MTGIENLDGVLTLMKAEGNSLMARYADEVDHAVKQFLESKRNFYCTNTDCQIKEAAEDAFIIEFNGNRYKAKEAKAHLINDRLIITGCFGVRGDLSAEIKIFNDNARLIVDAVSKEAK